MKRKFTAIMAAVMTAASLSVSPVRTVSQAADLNKDLTELLEADDYEKYRVTIWLKTDDKPEVWQIARNKVYSEYDYVSMTEFELEDTVRSLALGMLKDYYYGKYDEFVAKHDFPDGSFGAPSMFTGLVGAVLTSDQIREIAEDEMVEEVTSDKRNGPVIPEPEDKMTCEEFLERVVSDSEDFSDGGFIYRGDMKFDAISDGNGGFDLIVYDIPKELYHEGAGGPWALAKFDKSGKYTVLTTPICFYSGFSESGTFNDPDYGITRFRVTYFVEDMLPTTIGGSAVSIVDSSKIYPKFDLTKYFYDEVVPGDIDNSGSINAADASLVLSAYAYMSTGYDMNLNKVLFDFNRDGEINSDDASAILAEYAESATKN